MGNQCSHVLAVLTERFSVNICDVGGHSV